MEPSEQHLHGISPEAADALRSRRRLWRAWVVVVLGVLLVHSLTLTISPTIWRDEVQIVESGRLLVSAPKADWSVTWWPSADRPVLFFSYLGPVLQEASARLSAPSPAGPRAASVLGGALAASMAIAWLLARKIRPSVAFALGFALLLDPLFTESYRGARVDCWVVALCLAAAWALRRAQGRVQRGLPVGWLLASAGGLSAAAFLTWPTAILLYPLVLSELVGLWRERATTAATSKDVLAFGFGGVLGILALALPLWPVLGAVLQDMRPVLVGNQAVPKAGLELDSLVRPFRISPLLPAAALVGAVFKRNRGLARASELLPRRLGCSPPEGVDRTCLPGPKLVGAK